MTGRISLLVDSPLRDLVIAMREVPAEVRKRINSHTKSEAEPIWFDEMRGRASNRLQQRSLVDSARVGVTARNVFLRSGAVGSLSSGTPASVIANPAEYGANPNRQVRQRSRKGKTYTRRMGGAFGAPTRRGNVFNPAAAASITRVASLWIQTYRRVVFDKLDGK